LVAFQAPLYQVLSLDAPTTAPTPPAQRPRPAAGAVGELRSLRAILQQTLEGRT
jgi:hypothetical protein